MKSVYTVIISGSNRSHCKKFHKDFATWAEADAYIENEKKLERHKGLLAYDIEEWIVEDDYQLK